MLIYHPWLFTHWVAGDWATPLSPWNLQVRWKGPGRYFGRFEADSKQLSRVGERESWPPSVAQRRCKASKGPLWATHARCTSRGHLLGVQASSKQPSFATGCKLPLIHVFGLYPKTSSLRGVLHRWIYPWQLPAQWPGCRWHQKTLPTKVSRALWWKPIHQARHLYIMHVRGCESVRAPPPVQNTYLTYASSKLEIMGSKQMLLDCVSDQGGCVLRRRPMFACSWLPNSNPLQLQQHLQTFQKSMSIPSHKHSDLKSLIEKHIHTMIITLGWSLSGIIELGLQGCTNNTSFLHLLLKEHWHTKGAHGWILEPCIHSFSLHTSAYDPPCQSCKFSETSQLHKCFVRRVCGRVRGHNCFTCSRDREASFLAGHGHWTVPQPTLWGRELALQKGRQAQNQTPASGRWKGFCFISGSFKNLGWLLCEHLRMAKFVLGHSTWRSSLKQLVATIPLVRFHANLRACKYDAC